MKARKREHGLREQAFFFGEPMLAVKHPAFSCIVSVTPNSDRHVLLRTQLCLQACPLLTTPSTRFGLALPRPELYEAL